MFPRTHLLRRLLPLGGAVTASSTAFAPADGRVDFLVIGEGHAGDAAADVLGTTHGATVRRASAHSVESLNVQMNRADFVDGTSVKYSQCLLAPGGVRANEPRHIHPVARAQVGSLATADDVSWLRESLRTHLKQRDVVVCGGGFAACAIACSLSACAPQDERRNSVALLCPDSHVLGHTLPRYLTSPLARRLESVGVQLHTHSALHYVQRLSGPWGAEGGGEEGSIEVTVTKTYDMFRTKRFTANLMLLAPSRLKAETGLADDKEIEIDKINGGLVCNAFMQCAPNVWGAGEATSLPHPLFGRVRMNGDDFERETGLTAARNMAYEWSLRRKQQFGKAMDLGPAVSETLTRQPFEHVPVKRCLIGAPVGVHCVCVGDCNSDLPSFGFWRPRRRLRRRDDRKARESSHRSDGSVCGAQPIFGRGVVFYVRNDRVVGVLLWGHPPQQCGRDNEVAAPICELDEMSFSELLWGEVQEEGTEKAAVQLEEEVGVVLRWLVSEGNADIVSTPNHSSKTALQRARYEVLAATARRVFEVSDARHARQNAQAAVANAIDDLVAPHDLATDDIVSLALERVILRRARGCPHLDASHFKPARRFQTRSKGRPLLFRWDQGRRSKYQKNAVLLRDGDSLTQKPSHNRSMAPMHLNQDMGAALWGR